jgi:hypothetical protein
MMQLIKIVALIFLITSCNKKSANNNLINQPVPSVPVQITIYPNDISNFSIQAIGGWMYLPGGIRGIILYRKSQEEFVAIERTSSYSPNNDAAIVKVQSNNFTLRDTVSESQWRIFDGTVTKGPAEWPLRLYGTTYDGNVLRIVN